MSNSATTWTPACQGPLSFTIRVSSNFCPLSWWCYPTILSSASLFSCVQSPPTSGSFPMSRALCIKWSKYWNFSFKNSPSNEYSGLIFFRTDWFDSPRDSKESSLAPQFKNINSLVLRLLYGLNIYTNIRIYSWINYYSHYFEETVIVRSIKNRTNKTFYLTSLFLFFVCSLYFIP